jgi:hypothetical protein
MEIIRGTLMPSGMKLIHSPQRTATTLQHGGTGKKGFSTKLKGTLTWFQIATKYVQRTTSMTSSRKKDNVRSQSTRCKRKHINTSELAEIGCTARRKVTMIVTVPFPTCDPIRSGARIKMFIIR